MMVDISNNKNSKTDLHLNLNIFELVLAAMLASALGVAFWGWTFVYALTRPFLQAVGLKYTFAGFWIISAIFPSYIIRKPGVALFSSLLASIIEGTLTNWGIMSALWGTVQGVGAELVFALSLYRHYHWFWVCLSAATSATASYLLDYFYYHYSLLSTNINIIQYSSFVLSSIIFAGLLTIFLSKKLIKTGLLCNFKIVKR